MNHKKGYFFILDAVIGLFILFIGILLISSSYVFVQQPAQVELLVSDVLDLLATKKIRDINNPYGGVGGKLWNEKIITNSENSLIQQIGQFYYYKNYDLAENFTRNISEGIVPSQFTYELWIDDYLIYPQHPGAVHNISKKKSELLLASRKITFGIANESTSEMWGPYKAEVFLWKR